MGLWSPALDNCLSATHTHRTCTMYKQILIGCSNCSMCSVVKTDRLKVSTATKAIQGCDGLIGCPSGCFDKALLGLLWDQSTCKQLSQAMPTAKDKEQSVTSHSHFEPPFLHLAQANAVTSPSVA